MSLVYDPPPKGLVADSIRTIETSIALKIAVTDATTAAAHADADALRAILADLERGDIHLGVTIAKGNVCGRSERLCSHQCRLQVTARGVA